VLIAVLQAMQYASPKAVWNQLFGVTQPPLEQKGELLYLFSYLMAFVDDIYKYEYKLPLNLKLHVRQG